MKKGFTLVEILVGILVSIIILAVVSSLYLTSNRVFKTNREVNELTEDVRNAITTLEFVFSRWGVGVPCPQSGCNIQNTLPPCGDTFPPSDPQCIDIGTNQVSFYANLYGIGFVQSVNNDTANLISCRLSTNSSQNCYYVFNSQDLKTGYDSNGLPIAVKLNGLNPNNIDCLNSPSSNATASTTLNAWTGSTSATLSAGDYIIRVPHKVTLRFDGNNLYMDRNDMESGCNDNENSVLIGRASSFSVTKNGRSVIVDVVFIGQNGRQYRFVKTFGR